MRARISPPPVWCRCRASRRTILRQRSNPDWRSFSIAKAAAGLPDVCVLEGGLSAWKEAGLPTRLDRKQPIELQRQVMIVAGSLVVTGLLLGAFVSPWFAAISAFMGCGLVFAGISGWCGLAKFLMLMPWNKVAA